MKITVPHTPNELSAAILGMVAVNPFCMHDSASRLQMFCSHFGQHLVTQGATRKRLTSLVEREYGKYTFNIKMPVDARIIDVINKYPVGMGTDNIRENPTTLIIFEDTAHDLQEVGAIELPKFHCLHQAYGFDYQYKPMVARLREGNFVPKGTILGDAPNITEDGDMMFGMEVNVLKGSHPYAIEDGFVVSETLIKMATTKGYGSRILSWGKNRYPLLINNGKPFPDIGESLGADGLLCAMREYDELLAVTDMSTEAMGAVDYGFDELVYAEPNAKIVDIVVHHDNDNKPVLPIGLEVQCSKYINRLNQYYDHILAVYHKLKRERGPRLKMADSFHTLVVQALAYRRSEKEKIRTTFNKVPSDEYRVEIFFEYPVVPRPGGKLTDCHGHQPLNFKSSARAASGSNSCRTPL